MYNSTDILWIILGTAFTLFFLYYLRTFFTWLGGVWYDQRDQQSPPQKIRLSQLGPFIWGHADVEGGSLSFNGWFNGKDIKVKRKDFGRVYLAKLGFPESVLNDLDGSEMAKITLRFNKKTGNLEGEHFPQKIEISTTRPPKIINRIYLPAKPRKWTRRP